MNPVYRQVPKPQAGPAMSNQAGHDVLDQPRNGHIDIEANPGAAYVVKRGVWLLESSSINHQTSTHAIFFKNDLVAPKFLPKIPGLKLRCATEFGTVAQYRCEPEVGGALSLAGDVQIGNQFARSMIHTIILSTMTADQRVAALLLKFSSFGPRDDMGFFNVPLSREQMAQYTALNTNTLSRTISQLQSSHVIEMKRRSQFRFTSSAALAQLVPLHETIVNLFSFNSAGL